MPIKTANDIVGLSLEILKSRDVNYDNEGERSMQKCIEMFNAYKGTQLISKDGYVFMALLKLARSEMGKDKLDNYIDAVNYLALAGEEFIAMTPPTPTNLQL